MFTTSSLRFAIIEGGCALARVKVCTYAGGEQRIPPPEGLFPERQAPDYEDFASTQHELAGNSASDARVAPERTATLPERLTSFTVGAAPPPFPRDGAIP